MLFYRLPPPSTSNQGILVGNVSSGRVVHLTWPICGIGIAFTPANMRSGAPGILFENSLWWASGFVPVCGGLPPNGCNNGTCILPNTCDCTTAFPGYSGST